MNFKLTLKHVVNGIRSRGPTILSIGASIGVIATAISAAKATPKAIDISKQLKLDDSAKKEDRSKIVEILKLYRMTFIFGSVTIAAIIASDRINVNRINSLSGAYRQLQAKHLDYTSAAACLFGGAEANEAIRDKQASDVYAKAEKMVASGQFIFVDEYSKQDFAATKDDVLSALYMLNRTAQIKRCVPLNLYYSLLGLPSWTGDGSLPGNSGDLLVWDMDELAGDGKEWIDILPIEHKEEDGTVWYSLVMLDEPVLAEWIR